MDDRQPPPTGAPVEDYFWLRKAGRRLRLALRTRCSVEGCDRAADRWTGGRCWFHYHEDFTKALEEEQARLVEIAHAKEEREDARLQAAMERALRNVLDEREGR